MNSGSYSMQSESSSKFNEESRQKIDSLIRGLENLGWEIQKELSQDEILYFLNSRARDGQFDPTLAQKLFSILDINNNNKITGEDFIKGYLQFESDLKKSNDEYNRKFLEEQKNLNDLEEQCRLYKSEKLNSEGFCENAKITVEITDVDIKKPLEGINSIKIIVIYNEKTEEIQFEIGSSNALINKRFEFKPTSRRDHFEFIMKGINLNNEEFDIGRKTFPLNEITSQEEYKVQITVPEIDAPDTIAAYINANIVLFWSDYAFFEEKKKKSEHKYKKYNDVLNKTNQYLKKIKEIYGDFSKIDEKINSNIEMSSLRNNNNNYINNNYQNVYNDKIDNFAQEKLQTGRGQYGEQGYIMEENDINQIDAGKSQITNNIKGGRVAKLCALLCLILSLISCLKRPDFPNILGMILIIICSFIVSNVDIDKASKMYKIIFYSVIGLIIYDFLWLVTHYDIALNDKRTGGNENVISFFAVIFCGANIIVKSFLAVLLLNQLNYMKKQAQYNNNNGF